MDDDELYDEFGNYLGPEVDAHDDSSDDEPRQQQRNRSSDGDQDRDSR